MKLSTVLALAAIVAFTQAPVDGADLEEGPPEVILAKPVHGVLPATLRTIFGVTVGTASLSDVEKRLGKAAIQRTGRSADRSKSLCYKSALAGDDTVVLFEAGPLGGFQDITAVTIGSSSDFGRIATGCAVSSRVSRSTARIGGLRLGVQIDSVTPHLGVVLTPTEPGFYEVALERDRKRAARGGDEDVTVTTASGIKVHASAGVTTWFSVYYTEST